MKLLKRDNIKLEEVVDYHIYPIADNDTPKLSSDRLEYTLSNGLGIICNLWNIEEIKEIYNNIEIQIDEEGNQELGFKSKEIAEKFVRNMSILSKTYASNKRNLSMQFIADVIKKMNSNNLITKNDLYELSEIEVINKIENCNFENISKKFDLWKNTTHINESDNFVNEKYCQSISTKKRYIVPLVREDNQYKRIDEVSIIAKNYIESFLNYKPKKYAYFDFNF